MNACNSFYHNFFQHGCNVLGSIHYIIYRLFSRYEKISDLLWKINYFIEEKKIIVLGQDINWLSNMHDKTITDMVIINNYCVRNSLLNYFKKSMELIAEKSLICLFFPTVKQWKERKIPDDKIFSTGVLALPLKYYSYSSSDDTILLVNKRSVDLVLKKFARLCKRFRLERNSIKTFR